MIGQTVRASGETVICNDIDAHRKGLGMECVELSTPREKLPSGAGQNELAVDQVLANFVAELFATLHPATLPMLERMLLRSSVTSDVPRHNGALNEAADRHRSGNCGPEHDGRD